MLKDRLREARKNAGLTLAEVAERVGVSRQTIHRYENGIISNIPSSNIEKMAIVLNTTPEYLMGWQEDQRKNESIKANRENSASLPPNAFAVPGGHRIPILGHIVAGTPIETIEDIIGYVEIDSRTAKCGKYFALEVKGSSMEPTLHDGDIIIVRQQEDIESGEMAVVLVNGNEATVKEVKESRDGLTLIGHNVAVYTPHFYSWEDVERLPVSVLGKVIEARRRF